jgi:MoaA/NifB/PqqE/SkfB family radical SAM enzyme
MEAAAFFHADVIAFEHLDRTGRIRGSKKQRLHMWKTAYVQAMVESRVHRAGMRVSRVCAWNTSRLAFDGSGRVRRGKESDRTGGNYSLCEFTTGKMYHCDLNASYNIGARYFVREITKSLPEKERLALEAKVPEAARRSTCTLSTLINLHAVLAAEAA